MSITSLLRTLGIDPRGLRPLRAAKPVLLTLDVGGEWAARARPIFFDQGAAGVAVNAWLSASHVVTDDEEGTYTFSAWVYCGAANPFYGYLQVDFQGSGSAVAVLQLAQFGTPPNEHHVSTPGPVYLHAKDVVTVAVRNCGPGGAFCQVGCVLWAT